MGAGKGGVRVLGEKGNQLCERLQRNRACSGGRCVCWGGGGFWGNLEVKHEEYGFSLLHAFNTLASHI